MESTVQVHEMASIKTHIVQILLEYFDRPPSEEVSIIVLQVSSYSIKEIDCGPVNMVTVTALCQNITSILVAIGIP